jgi:WD40 repeat protein
MDSSAKWIVTAGAAGHAMLWDRASGEKLLTVHHEQPVRDVSFKPGGTLFVTASADRTAEVWDAAKKRGIVTLRGHKAPVYSARFTPYGPGVVTVSWDRTARLWNYETKKCLAILRGHSDALWAVEFSPSGTNFTTTSNDGTARLWDLKRIPGGDAFLPPAPASAK